MTPEALAALDPDEQKAFTYLQMAGYRIIDGKIYKTVTESEEGESIWTGEYVAESSGWLQQDYEDLLAAGKPRHALEIMCGTCGDVDVPGLGDRCESCEAEYWAQERAEEAISMRKLR